MKKSKILIIIAAIINLFTALIHMFFGELELIKPLINSDLNIQVKTELNSVWHMVTIILFVTSIILLKIGLTLTKNKPYPVLDLIALLYLLFSLSFVSMSVLNTVFAPQWLLLLPIAIFTYLGKKLNLK